MLILIKDVFAKRENVKFFAKFKWKNKSAIKIFPHRLADSFVLINYIYNDTFTSNFYQNQLLFNTQIIFLKSLEPPTTTTYFTLLFSQNLIKIQNINFYNIYFIKIFKFLNL